jgi:signal transduction histidine kinase
MPTSSQPLKKSVDRVLNRLELVALEKDITLSSSIDAVRVLIGVAELETVLYNLIHNAIKFTPRGGKITVKNNAKILTVEDTGIGIDQKHIPVLFDRFYKADASRTYQGSGLGLSLVKEILDTSNATITVRSELTKGTVFTVVFK